MGNYGCAIMSMVILGLGMFGIICAGTILGVVLTLAYALSPSELAPLTPFQQRILSTFNMPYNGSVRNIDSNTFSMQVNEGTVMVINILRALDSKTEKAVFSAMSASDVSSQVSCCSTSGIYLPTDRPFTVYTNGYSSTLANTAVSRAIATWEAVIPSLSIFGNYQINIVETPTNQAIISDAANQIIFNREYSAEYADVLAITRRTFNHEIITGWDMWINSGNYQIGDVTQLHIDRMYDLESLILHEAGHALALNDLTSASCMSSIMYGYLQSETQKRTVDATSKYCLANLYPSSAGLKSLVDQYASNLNIAGASTLSSLLYFFF